MTTLMRSGSKPSIGKTREGPREERARAFDWDPISGLHQGQQPERLHSKAEYMAAPERFAERQIHLASRAPSIHGTYFNHPLAVIVRRFVRNGAATVIGIGVRKRGEYDVRLSTRKV
jgi:hypothetical protein